MQAMFKMPKEGKSIYFKLNNSLHLLDPPTSSTYKISGIYAIYKNDICYYVGQSKNLPSRVATHLSGKYSVADRVDLFFVDLEAFGDFYDRSKEDQSRILENNESRAIDLLEPIENILVKNEDVGDEFLFEVFTECGQLLYPNATVRISSEFVTVLGDIITVMQGVYSVGGLQDMFKEEINKSKDEDYV